MEYDIIWSISIRVFFDLASSCDVLTGKGTRKKHPVKKVKKECILRGAF